MEICQKQYDFFFFKMSRWFKKRDISMKRIREFWNRNKKKREIEIVKEK